MKSLQITPKTVEDMQNALNDIFDPMCETMRDGENVIVRLICAVHSKSRLLTQKYENLIESKQITRFVGRCRLVIF